MRTHMLKTDPQVFRLSWRKVKPYEIRLDDRKYRLGDKLILQETVYSGEQMASHPRIYTGRELEVTVLSKISGVYGLKPGWCVMGVRECTRRKGRSLIRRGK